MTSVPSLAFGAGFTLFAVCCAAEALDQAADELSAGIADLPLSPPRCAAVFSRIDRMMASWHALRLIAASLPAEDECATRARAALLGPDDADAQNFSIAFLVDFAHSQNRFRLNGEQSFRDDWLAGHVVRSAIRVWSSRI